VRASNREGSTDSDVATITLADLPEAPATVVRKVQELSSTSSLALEFDALPSESMNGLPVLSYSIEIDSKLDGNFIALIGYESDSLTLTYLHLVQGLVTSQTYGLRYRARN